MAILGIYLRFHGDNIWRHFELLSCPLQLLLITWTKQLNHSTTKRKMKEQEMATLSHQTHINLEPQTTIDEWMFGETSIFYIKIWNHPIETTIKKWMFRVPGIHIPWRIHGTIVYLPTWMVDFYGKLVGEYTSPMEAMGYKTRKPKHNIPEMLHHFTKSLSNTCSVLGWCHMTFV